MDLVCTMRRCVQQWLVSARIGRRHDFRRDGAGCHGLFGVELVFWSEFIRKLDGRLIEWVCGKLVEWIRGKLVEWVRGQFVGWP